MKTSFYWAPIQSYRRDLVYFLRIINARHSPNWADATHSTHMYTHIHLYSNICFPSSYINLFRENKNKKEKQKRKFLSSNSREWNEMRRWGERFLIFSHLTPQRLAFSMNLSVVGARTFGLVYYRGFSIDILVFVVRNFLIMVEWACLITVWAHALVISNISNETYVLRKKRLDW